jgi:hypothetical protein
LTKSLFTAGLKHEISLTDYLPTGGQPERILKYC